MTVDHCFDHMISTLLIAIHAANDVSYNARRYSPARMLRFDPSERVLYFSSV
jgi:hypothetical protein